MTIEDEAALKKAVLMAEYGRELSRLRGMQNLWLAAQNRMLAMRMRIEQETKVSIDLQRAMHAQLKVINELIPGVELWH